MKRKITEIEQKLIEDGFQLKLKRYTGKHSEKSYCYEYTREYENRTHVVILNSKRDNVIKYGIDDIHIEFVDKEELKELHRHFFLLKHYVETVLLGLTYEEKEIDPMELESVE